MTAFAKVDGVLRCRAAAVAVAVVTAVAIASPVAGAKPIRLIRAEGSITYTWTGDPARGCAAEGLCTSTGSIVVRPDGGASGGASGPPHVEISDEEAVARSERLAADGSAVSSCADPVSVDISFALRHARGGGLHAVLDGLQSVLEPRFSRRRRASSQPGAQDHWSRI